MKKFITILLLLSLSTFAQSLSKVYVLSEGGFNAGTSMLSMFDKEENSFTQNIFSPGNLGTYPDGLVCYENNLYIAEQGNYGGPGKFYKLDTLGTIIGSLDEVGTNPYSVAISNGKAYLTNGPANNVSVVNISDMSLVTEIGVGITPQEIIAYENYVFVANTYIWNGASDSTVSVIDSETDEVVNSIVVSHNPTGFALTNDNNLLVGCSDGMIYKVEINSLSKTDSFSVTDYGFGKDIFVDKNSSNIYFLGSSGEVVSLNLETKETSLVIGTDDLVYAYGYGYDYVNNTHYRLDAKDFAANGSLVIYDSEGNVLNTYETSIAPRRVVFKYNGEITGVEDDEEIATSYELNQNYPNPFNPTTTINFSIPKASNVTIKVYNSIGQQVAELINSELGAGSHNINFNASNLSSGVYYCRIQSGSFTATRKMMLVK